LTLDSHAYLRKSFDGKETIVSGGHGILKTAGATQHAARMKRVPVWALDDKKLKEFINLRFPKARTDPEQRRLASRMVRIIYLYYRVGYTSGAVAEELNMTPLAVRQLICRLERAMKKPLKPSYRPKKGVTIGATNEDNGDGHITL
jgi:hypothetical protein